MTLRMKHLDIVFAGTLALLSIPLSAQNRSSEAFEQGSCNGLVLQNLNRSAFATVVAAFSHKLGNPTEASRFLTCVRGQNMQLAETLMLFQRRLAEPGSNKAAGIEWAFVHYVINTQAVLNKERNADFLRLYRAYCNALPLPEDFSCSAAGPSGRTWTQEDLRAEGQKANKARYGREDVVPVDLLEFDATAVRHSWRNAVWMAEMSALAYWDTRLRRKQLERWGYRLAAEIVDPGTDTSAFLAVKDHHVVLSFRGTSSLKNVLTDLNAIPATADWAPGKIHRGFGNAADKVWTQIKEKLDALPGRDIWVTGHSLGAALAQLTAIRLEGRVRAVYTFGTPRVGDENFAKGYDRALVGKTFAHVNDQDVVTRVPSVLGYTHAARKTMTCFSNTGHELAGCAALLGAPPLAQAANQLRRAIRETTAFLPAALRPRDAGPSDGPVFAPAYSTEPFAASAFRQHGSFEYLFKLVCASIEYDLWPQVLARANASAR